MPTSVALPKDAPVMVAWSAYKETEEFANSKRWASHAEHVDGSLWAAFEAGFRAAQTPDQAPQDQHSGGWVMVPREPSRDWAVMLAEKRQGKNHTPRCEPPGEYEVTLCREIIEEVLATAPSPPTDLTDRRGEDQSFQAGVNAWMLACFGPEVAADKTERNFRFLEEALELVQANCCSREDALRLVDYVFNRPVGEPDQEVGGVMVCLAALCAAAGLNMDGAGRRELERINRPEIMAKVRAKHAAKEIRSPLPGNLGDGGVK